MSDPAPETGGPGAEPAPRSGRGMLAGGPPGREAWLFVRAHQAVYIARHPMGNTLLVCGPGRVEHSHHFDSEATLYQFRQWYEEHLLGDGWVPTADRRTRQVSPPGEERRRPSNDVP